MWPSPSGGDGKWVPVAIAVVLQIVRPMESKASMQIPCAIEPEEVVRTFAQQQPPQGGFQSLQSAFALGSYGPVSMQKLDHLIMYSYAPLAKQAVSERFLQAHAEYLN